jgi:hypothetical protein
MQILFAPGGFGGGQAVEDFIRTRHRGHGTR